MRPIVTPFVSRGTMMVLSNCFNQILGKIPLLGYPCTNFSMGHTEYFSFQPYLLSYPIRSLFKECKMIREILLNDQPTDIMNQPTK
jgi:hypothetical protein